MFKPQNQLIPASATVEGDTLKFAQYAPVWRRTLELVHMSTVGEMDIEEDPEVCSEDHIVGRYVWLDLPSWGGYVFVARKRPCH